MKSRKIFTYLSLTKKFELISEQGKYIGVREYYNHFINLYSIGDDFIEVWYFRPENKITKIEKLTDLRTLDLYISHMNKLDSL